MGADVTDLELALAAKGAYSGTPTFDSGIAHLYVTRLRGAHVFACRGSVSFLDWAQDLDGLPEQLTVLHKDLGYVHKGWLADAQSLLPFVAGYVHALPSDAELCFCGHSKGAPDAGYLACMLKVAGVKITRFSGFGVPRMGTLQGMLEDVPGVNDQDDGDVVCVLPPWLGLSRPLTHVTTAGPPVTWHSIDRYIEALKMPPIKQEG